MTKNTSGEFPDRSSTSGSKTLDTLSTSFDDLLERLQKPGAREAMDAAFHASPEELGRTAVEKARRLR
jgi:antitoxin Phd